MTTTPNQPKAYLAPGSIAPSLSLSEYGAGTAADPHIFVGMIRDHRGLRQSRDRVAWETAKQRLVEEVERASSSFLANTMRYRLDRFLVGAVPFETFTNLADGKKWGKFYDPRSTLLIIKPVPSNESWIKGVISWVGDGIVWFGTKTWEGLVAGCKKFTEVSEGQLDEVALMIVGAASGPGTAAAVKSAQKTALQICKTVATVNTIFQSSSPGVVPDEAAWDRPNTVVTARRAAKYPTNAFAVYDPSTAKFIVLVPRSTP